MKHTSLIRLGGLAPVVGGVIFAIVNFLADPSYPAGGTRVWDHILVSDFLLPLSMMAVIVAIHLLHRERGRYGLGGTRAFFTALVGVALILGGNFLSVFIPDKAGILHLLFLMGDLLFLVGMLAATVGIIRLAVVTLAVGVLPRWGGVALIAGIPLLPFIIDIFYGVFFGTSNVTESWLVALPWIVVGYAVFRAATRQAQQPSRLR
jgi:hypothetical protein